MIGRDDSRPLTKGFDNCYNVSKNFSLRDVAQYLNINSTD